MDLSLLLMGNVKASKTPQQVGVGWNRVVDAENWLRQHTVSHRRSARRPASLRANCAGFSSATNFRRAFKSRIGKTPTARRRKA
jgi:methylphosphotriester-DNA--protein-cysteine methyltransferase